MSETEEEMAVPLRYCPQCGQRLEIEIATGTTSKIWYDEKTDTVKEEETGKIQDLISYCEKCDTSYQILNSEEN